jgi:hypothetical protein
LGWFIADALTGYQTISSLNNDWKTVTTHWYNRFVAAPEPGSLCDPVGFAVGDTFATTVGLFTWVIQGLAESPISYKGSSLDLCDVGTMTMALDSRSWTASVTVTIGCKGQLHVIATTGISSSLVSDWSSDLLVRGPDVKSPSQALITNTTLLYVLVASKRLWLTSL